MAHLCKNCQTFFHKPKQLSEIPARIEYAHSSTISEARGNARSGCAVCALISRKLDDLPVQEDEPISFAVEDYEDVASQARGWQMVAIFRSLRVIYISIMPYGSEYEVFRALVPVLGL